MEYTKKVGRDNYRPFLYSRTDHGSFIAQTACFCRHVSFQLRCSGQHKRNWLQKRMWLTWTGRSVTAPALSRVRTRLAPNFLQNHTDRLSFRLTGSWRLGPVVGGEPPPPGSLPPPQNSATIHVELIFAIIHFVSCNIPTAPHHALLPLQYTKLDSPD